jgi:hypothetical protein
VRWTFELPGVVFEREWSLGHTTFHPPGATATEVEQRAGQANIHTSWAVAHEAASEVAERWKESSTIAVDAAELDEARTSASEAMAVLRFLMREVVTVNVDIHRIGLVGEVDRAIRDYVTMSDNMRVAPGWIRIDSPVPFRFDVATLARWDVDQRVCWLSEQLALADEHRTELGRRSITSLRVLDEAFLTTDPVTSVVLYAVAVEVLLSNAADPESDENRPTSALRIAGRVAYLTCGARCARDRPACPYVLGVMTQKQLRSTAVQWASKGEWRCSAFLQIARPPGMDAYFSRPALFTARNEAVHEGHTSLDEDGIRWLRSTADEAVGSVLAWASSTAGRSIADLDREIANGADRLGALKPGDG